jgi:hypothetical protein
MGWPARASIKPTAPLVGSGEKLGTDPWVGQSACYGLCREPFSQKQWDSSKSVSDPQAVAICGPRGICEKPSGDFLGLIVISH